MEKQQSNGQQPKKRKKSDIGYFLLLELGIEFAAIIALPLLGFIYAGKRLDAKFQTKYFVIIAILLALALSSYLIYKKIMEAANYIKRK